MQLATGHGEDEKWAVSVHCVAGCGRQEPAARAHGLETQVSVLWSGFSTILQDGTASCDQLSSGPLGEVEKWAPYHRVLVGGPLAPADRAHMPETQV